MKKGVKPQNHGVIYEQGKKPKLQSGEPSLGFRSVRSKLTVEYEKLSPESRVNYSKFVTVEHNVKVFFIGHVISEDLEIVSNAVNECWERKVAGRKPKRWSFLERQAVRE